MSEKYSFCRVLNTVLNDLELHLPYLLKPSIQPVFEKQVSLDDFHIVLLHSNNQVIMEAFFRSIFDITFTRQGTTTIGDVDLPYMFSDRHIEIDLCEEAIVYLKQVVKNKTLSASKFIFYIKGVNRNNFHLQRQLKNIIETSHNSLFVITAKSLSNVQPVLQSLSIQLNLGFPLEKIMEWYDIYSSSLLEDCTFSRAEVESIYSTDHDFINLVLKMSMNAKKSKLEEALYKFLDQETTKNKYDLVAKSREMAYKLYHMNVPISYICRSFTSFFQNYDYSCSMKLIELASQAEYMSCISKKDVLSYERFLIDVLSIPRIAKLQNSEIPKKKVVKKKS